MSEATDRAVHVRLLALLNVNDLSASRTRSTSAYYGSFLLNPYGQRTTGRATRPLRRWQARGAAC